MDFFVTCIYYKNVGFDAYGWQHLIKFYDLKKVLPSDYFGLTLISSRSTRTNNSVNDQNAICINE